MSLILFGLPCPLSPTALASLRRGSKQPGFHANQNTTPAHCATLSAFQITTLYHEKWEKNLTSSFPRVDGVLATDATEALLTF